MLNNTIYGDEFYKLSAQNITDYFSLDTNSSWYKSAATSSFSSCFTGPDMIPCVAAKSLLLLPKMAVEFVSKTPIVAYSFAKRVCSFLTPETLATNISKISAPIMPGVRVVDDFLSEEINFLATSAFGAYALKKMVKNGVETLRSMKTFFCCQFTTTTRYYNTSTHEGFTDRIVETKSLFGSQICGKVRDIAINAGVTGLWGYTAYVTYQVVQEMILENSFPKTAFDWTSLSWTTIALVVAPIFNTFKQGI